MCFHNDYSFYLLVFNFVFFGKCSKYFFDICFLDVTFVFLV